MASTLEVDKLKHSGDDPISGNAAHAFELPYADGTEGQALVTDGSKTLAFETVGGVNTGWNLIQTANITSSISSLVVSEATSGAWDGMYQLKIVMTNLITGSDATRVKMSNDGGSNYGAWDQYSASVYNDAGFKGSQVGWGQEYAYIFDNTFRATSGQKMMFEMDIFMDGNDICYSGRGDGNDSGGDHCFNMCKGVGLALTAIDWIEFESLAWTGGQVRLYGLTVS